MFDHFNPPPTQPVEQLATLVDVTLRDGGFEVDFHWPKHAFGQVPAALGPLGIDVVELGYIGGVPLEHAVATPGIGAFLTPDLVAAAPRNDVQLAAMIHPTALDTQIDFAAFAAAGLAMVRLVYHPNWFDQITRIAATAKDHGLTITVNIALASRYPTDALLTHAAQISEATQPDVLYIADTCGALRPDQVSHLISSLRETTQGDLGFHAHDFLTLGYANSIAAAAAGASYLDCSILGLGRGAGNLQTELALICHRLPHRSIVDAAARFLECRRELAGLAKREERSLISMVCGALNLTPVEETALLNLADTAHVEASEAALRLVASGLDASTLRSDKAGQGWLVPARSA
jgi:isopropylmalate/homocitrate/citramalate synthase